MGFILAIIAVPVVSGTGIYNPEVMKNGRCIAEPGGLHALFCPAPSVEPKRRYSTKKYNGKKYVRR